MFDVKLSDTVYKQVAEAAEAQNVTVEQFVTEAVQLHLQDKLDNRFTPEVIAHLDRIAADLDRGGKTYTPAQVSEHLAANRDACLKKHPN